MRENKLTIQIDKPINKVFAFVINPNNTHKWVDSIVFEQTNEWPVKVGTIYKNKGTNNILSKYILIEYKENDMFVMKNNNNNYYVKYTLRSINNRVTELEYYEWVKSGNLENPFTYDVLKKLKSILER